VFTDTDCEAAIVLVMKLKSMKIILKESERMEFTSEYSYSDGNES